MQNFPIGTVLSLLFFNLSLCETCVRRYISGLLSNIFKSGKCTSGRDFSTSLLPLSTKRSFFLSLFSPIHSLLVGWSQRRNEQLNLETALYHMQLAKRLNESAHNSFMTIYADNVVLIK